VFSGGRGFQALLASAWVLRFAQDDKVVWDDKVVGQAEVESSQLWCTSLTEFCNFVEHNLSPVILSEAKDLCIPAAADATAFTS